MRRKSDAELVRRVRDGNGAALDALLREYGAKLIDIAASITGSYDLAQDVVQDVFIKLWDTRANINIQGSVQAYLYRAVRNRALDIHKHENAQRKLESRIHNSHDNEEPRVNNAGESQVLNAELDIAVQQALKSLSPKLREVFLLRVYHDLSYAEIAQILGIALTSVHIQMYRAHKALAARLELWSNPEG